MKRKACAAALSLALSFLAAPAVTPALAQTKALPTPFMDVSDASYKAPADKNFQPIYEALRQRQVLQEMRDFLKPVHLPKKLDAVVKQCNAPTLPYQPGQPVTICYEMVARILQLAAIAHPNDADAQKTMVLAGFIQAALHETAHGILDILEVPIWGREDDAADRLAALVLVEFGEDVAKTVLLNAFDLFKTSAAQGKVWTGSDFADVSSPDAQRYYNYACIAAGADIANFGGLIQNKVIPESRAGFCAGWLTADDGSWITVHSQEYEQVLRAFNLRIMPFVDPDALVQARATPWLAWQPKK